MRLPPPPRTCVQPAGSRLLDATNLTEHLAGRVLEARKVDRGSLTDRTELARAALRRLVEIVPADLTKDYLIFARACMVRGDPTNAHEALKTWRANMRTI